MMNRRIKVSRVDRRSNNGKFFYIDPITAMPSEEFYTPRERDAKIALHYEEPDTCDHQWVAISTVRCRYEPGMISGLQRCSKCNMTSHYMKEED